MIRSSLTALERRLCSPTYLDVPALYGTGRVIGGEVLDLGPAAAVIVGEAPGPNTSAFAPVFPFPPTSAGGRLLAMSGIPAEEYLRRLARRNLLKSCPVNGWRKAERVAAQDAAREIYEEARGGRIVLLGANVARAFRPFTVDVAQETCRPAKTACGTEWLLLPHPSGRNPFYNAMSNRATVSDLLRRFASTPLPPCPACGASPAETHEYPWQGTCHCGARLRYARGIGSVEIECTEAA